MRRFTFTVTDSSYTGRGVDWEDGSASYEIKVGSGPYEKPFTGKVSDLTIAYGGLPGYTFTYLD